MGIITRACLAAAAGLLAAQAWAQDIYSCVDSTGRRLTSDRPILECLDREQRILGPSGTVRRVMNPSYTAAERAAIEAKARKQAEERHRLAEERQRQRALLLRYPSPDVLDGERAAAMAKFEDVIGTAHQRSIELLAQRRKLENEASFYAGEPSRMPPRLKHAIDENTRQLQAQERFIAGQNEEKLRMRQRFDEMQRQLDALWTQQDAPAQAP